MRVIMLSWEYPPKSVGGLAQHVYYLSRALARKKHDIHVITLGAPELPSYEENEGVTIHRVNPYHLSSPDFRTWVLHLNISILEYTVKLMNTLEDVDIIHAHDWLVAYAGRALKHAYQLPMVATIHATEFGRNQGLHNDDQRYISDVEWWLTYEAWRVICCSEYMKNELQGFFQLPQDKIKVIPNGVDPKDFEVKGHTREDLKGVYAPGCDKVIFFVGRLVREKGVQVLLDAAPKILQAHPRTKFFIAGKGPYESHLKQMAHSKGIADKVTFAGYIDDKTRNQLYALSDVAVFPSIYEPFGIVALEAMAARTPVVVSDTGGLREIVHHGIDGLKAYPGNANSLADNILAVLGNPGLAERLEKEAFHKITKVFNWDTIADQTMDVYKEVKVNSVQAGWQPSETGGRGFDHLYEKIRNIGRYSVFGARTQ